MASGIGGPPKPPVCRIKRTDSHHLTYVELMGGNFLEHTLQVRHCDLYNERQVKDAERELARWARKHKMQLLTD